MTDRIIAPDESRGDIADIRDKLVNPGDPFQVEIAASQLPLPVSASIDTTGLATEAGQDTGNASLASIDGKTPALGQALAAASTPVVLASDQLPLPVSASIDTTGLATSAGQDTGNASLASIDTHATSIDSKTRDPLASTGTQSSVDADVTSVALLSAAPRKGFSLFNHSSSIAYVLFATGSASATAFSVKMLPGSYYENPASPVYQGDIVAIWETAVGSMKVTEYT